ncbi:MAG: hypothetical protein ACFFDI_10455 [Promethearchaeota archaeon]
MTSIMVKCAHMMGSYCGRCALESVCKLSAKKGTEEHTGHNPCSPALLDERSWKESSLGGCLSWQGVTCQEIGAGLRQ